LKGEVQLKGEQELLPMAVCKLQVTLKLIETFVDKCEDLSLVTGSLVPAMMDPILGDYARNVPDARYASSLLQKEQKRISYAARHDNRVAPLFMWTVSLLTLLQCCL